MKALQLMAWRRDAELREMPEPVPGFGQVVFASPVPAPVTRTCT